MILSFIVDVVVDANVVDVVDVDVDHVPPALGERDCGSGQERHLELPCRGGRQQNGGWPTIFWRSQWSWLGLLLDLEEDYFNFCLSRFHGSGTRTLIYSQPEGAISNNPYDSVFLFPIILIDPNDDSNFYLNPYHYPLWHCHTHCCPHHFPPLYC